MASNLTNWTNLSTAARPPPPLGPDMSAAFLSSGIFLAIISPVTIILNGLLLITIFRDKSKTFHSPSGVFLVGLAFTDLLTGLVIEPLLLTCYFFNYHQHMHSYTLCPDVYKNIGILSIAVTNSSFLIVFAFTVAQYLVVSRPIKYKGTITNGRSIACVAIVWIYAVLFAMLRHFGVPKEIVEKLDVFLHSTLVLLLMIIVYILLHRSFSEKFKRGYILRAESSIQQTQAVNNNSKRQSKHLETERKFVRINLTLVLLLLFCTLPTTIAWYIQLFSKPLPANFFIVRVVVDNALWLKFMLDPVVYAWRLPKYRNALKNTLSITGK